MEKGLVDDGFSIQHGAREKYYDKLLKHKKPTESLLAICADPDDGGVEALEDGFVADHGRVDGGDDASDDDEASGKHSDSSGGDSGADGQAGGS